MTASSPRDGEISPSLDDLAVTRRPGGPSAGADVDVDAVTVDDLQRVMTAGLPALTDDRIGDWLLRAAEGYTGRANSALPVGSPGMPLGDAIDRVLAWYAEQGLPALLQLPHPATADPADSKLGSVLLQRDWRFFLRTEVMTKPSAPAVRGPHEQVRVTRTDAPTDDWWHTASPRALEHRDTLTRMLARVPGAAYLTAYVGEVAVGHARLAFTGAWSGIFDVHTDPAVRRSGVARALMSAAATTAADQRIPLQYLQVAADNTAAVRLYEALGWQVHHTYHYAAPDSSDSR
ncbi:GNAT family N-acetyltransferase [Flexivirga sp. B27]